MTQCKYKQPQIFRYCIFWQVSKLTLTLEQALKTTNTRYKWQDHNTIKSEDDKKDITISDGDN